MGRRPFPVNIASSIAVPLMDGATRTGPYPIPQCNEGIEGAADMTQFGGREKAVDMMDVGPELGGSLVQDLHKAPEAQIGDFASPQCGHTPQFQVFQIDRVILLTQRMGSVPMPGRPLVGNAPVHLCQRVSGLLPMAEPGSVRDSARLALRT
jgi:hypothetical protein